MSDVKLILICYGVFLILGGCAMLMNSPTVEKALKAEEKAYNLFCALTPMERAVIRSRDNRRFTAICPDETVVQ